MPLLHDYSPRFRQLPRLHDAIPPVLELETTISYLAILKSKLLARPLLSKTFPLLLLADAVSSQTPCYSYVDMISFAEQEIRGYIGPLTYARRLSKNYFDTLNFALLQLESPDAAVDIQTVKVLHINLMRYIATKHLPGILRTEGLPGAGNSDTIIFFMEDLIDFIVDPPLSIPFVIRLAMVYAQFLVIHPFPSGNTEIAQILQQMTLGLAGFPPIPMSQVMSTDAAIIEDELSRSGSEFSWVRWYSFFLKRFETALRRLIDQLEMLGCLQADFSDALAYRSDAAAWKLIRTLIGTPILSVSMVQRFLATSFQTANRAVRSLVERGILKEALLSDIRRPRIFYAPSVLNCVVPYSENDRDASNQDFAPGLQRTS